VTAAWVAKRLDFVSDFPEMERVLAPQADRASPAREVAVVVGELYDVLARMRLGVDMIERSVADLPELGAIFGAVRRELLARYERYLRAGAAAGRFHVEDPAVVAHLILDLCWWGAGRRPNDPDAAGVSDAAARAAVCALVADALAPALAEEPQSP
jgi:hypothetical protein